MIGPCGLCHHTPSDVASAGSQTASLRLSRNGATPESHSRVLPLFQSRARRQLALVESSTMEGLLEDVVEGREPAFGRQSGRTTVFS